LKRMGLVFVLVFAIVMSAVTLSSGWTTAAGGPQETPEKKHEFGVKQYEAFHDLLHPLQHEALPEKDFRRIRTKSALLVKRGNAILRLGVPRGVTETNKQEFAVQLNKFRQGIAGFRVDAKKGTDAELEASFSAVHDSFEMLAAILPR
jgi:hypothetical protein